MTTNDDVTEMINTFARGDDSVQDELFARIHDTLQGMARKAARGGDSLFLETGDLLSEVCIKLINQKKSDWSSRVQFFGFAARAMRRIRCDIARRVLAEKRGGGQAHSPHVELAPTTGPDPDATLIEAERIAALDEALTKLELLDARQAKVVEMRYFGEMTVPDTASVLGVSPRTIKNDTAMAISWLHREIGHPAVDLEV